MPLSRGAFIVFEGCDKVGKTTQCKKLVNKLLEAGIAAKYMNFPDRSTPTGKLIDAYLTSQQELTDKAIHLLFAANRWEQQPKMVSLLGGGCTLIVDRYSYSGVAFSAAKPNMDLEWCRAPEQGLPKPDSVFFLSLSPEAAARREQFGLERYERPKFQERVRENYEALRDDSWQVIDADKGIEELHQQLFTKTLQVIEKAQILPLGQLW
ncbi:thymidylate kinase [Bacillus rossius redtenbacheri]|uniref:thymidylate kinase n=1 Tax=Bacillus rossius redtenbacheri TaxID=93214 RepID=UPI002FDD6E31